MILKALVDYYQRLADDPSTEVAPYGFEYKPIPFLIIINKNGNFVNIRDARTGEKKEKVAREFCVPLGEKKTSGIKANLLWDNPQYVFGLSKSNSQKDIKKAKDAHVAFKKKIKETFSDMHDDGISGVLKFYESQELTNVLKDSLCGEVVETNANITFALDTDIELIAQRPAIVVLVKKMFEEKSGKIQTSAISGEKDEISVLHASIKGVWGAQTSGANIVGFNDNAYCSFGLTKDDQGLNSPIGKHDEFAYTTALNILLAKKSRQRMQIGDASTVFWGKKACALESDLPDYLSPPKGEGNISCEKIRALLSSIKTGIPPQEADLPFYVLGLSPNVSRIAVRFWYDGNVKEIKERIAQHFQDVKMLCPAYEREYSGLRDLLKATTRHSADHLYGDEKDVLPLLAGDFFRAIVENTLYPRMLLQRVVTRVKAEQGLSDKNGKRRENVSYARASIIKGFLVRQARLTKTKEKEVSMSLDREYDNIGYVLGRFFAVLERIQEQAQGRGLNKTIRDTYFSAAASSPLVTFKRLQDLAVHHLAKIRNSGKGTVWLEQLMQEVVGLVPPQGIPAILSMEDQGRFAIGYYHQRQDFFTKKEAEDKESNN